MLKTGLIYFAGRFGAALIAFLALAAYTRLLSPEGYGVYALVQAGVTMAYAGLMQWLMISLGRFMPQYLGREEIIRSHVAVAYLAAVACVLLVSPLVIGFLASDEIPRDAIALGIGVFLAMGLAELTLVQFNMLVQPVRYALFAFGRVAIATTTGILLVYAGFGAIGAITGVLIGHLTIILPNLRHNWGAVRLGLVERGLLRELASFGIPYALSGILAGVINLSDRYLIQWLLSTEAAGLYAAPYDLAMRSLHVLMAIVAMAGNPLIFRRYEADGWPAAAPLVRRQFELLAGVTLPVAICLAMLAPAVVSVLLGPPFHAAGRELLPWITLATVLQGFQGAYLSLAFALTKRPLKQTGFFVVGAVLNIGLNLWLIPRYELVGAAAATVAAFVLIAVCSLAFGRRLLPLPLPPRGCAKIALACAVLFAVLWPVAESGVSVRLVLHAAAGLAGYAAVIIGLDVAGTRSALIGASRALIGPKRE